MRGLFSELFLPQWPSPKYNFIYVVFVLQRRQVIPTALPTVGLHGTDLSDVNGEEVHVYAHPSKVVSNLQHPKEKDKVYFQNCHPGGGGGVLNKVL